MSKHTPGPWTVENASGVMLWIGAMRVPDEARYGLHTIITGIDIEDLTPEACAIKEANAHLIAAAPDLLEACEAVAATTWSRNTAEKIGAQVRAAIKKARGET